MLHPFFVYSFFVYSCVFSKRLLDKFCQIVRRSQRQMNPSSNPSSRQMILDRYQQGERDFSGVDLISGIR